MGPLLGKLPQELRDAIYEYVLDDNDAPMVQFGDGIQHWTIAELTVWFRATPPRVLPVQPLQAIDMNVLTVSKAVHRELLDTMYRTKTISLNRLQCLLIFKRKDVDQPEAFSGGIAMARPLLMRRHWSNVRTNAFRDHNTIDLQSFFTRIRHNFPHLLSVTVITDYTWHPNCSLFEIGIDLMSCDQVTKVTFDAIGSLVAETKFGFTVRVQHRRVFQR
jgi:hypothetical protein